MIVVTGATGHVGANVIRMLLERGERVRAVVHENGGNALDGLDIEKVKGDVTNRESLVAAFTRACKTRGGNLPGPPNLRAEFRLSDDLY